MTDRDEELRGLLRELADAGPVPPDVEAKLDDTLAELAAAHRPSDDLAVLRRRRRRVMALAGAAATVIGAIGIGFAANAPGRGSVESAGASHAEVPGGAESAPQDAPSPPESRTAPSPSTTSLDGLRVEGDTARESTTFGVAAVPAFSSARFAREVDVWVSLHRGDDPTGVGACVPVESAPDAGLFSVRYDGRPATLALLPPRDGRQVVLVYGCDDGRVPVNATSVPAG